MAKKDYDWHDGAVLEDHSKKKHTILLEYFSEYLRIRCKLPQQEKFKLVIVDGFSGAGLYKNGEFGSPFIFINTLINVTKEINIYRSTQKFKLINIECLIIFNDVNTLAIKTLEENLTPLLSGARETEKNLLINPIFFNQNFGDAYLNIRNVILKNKCHNVFFNLDQCGYSHVTSKIIQDITNTWRSSEILLTFMIQSFLAYLPLEDVKNSFLTPETLEKIKSIRENGVPLTKKEWLGDVEKIIFEHLKFCAAYVSPFSINNPNGWQYWLMHFATSHRARQVYNDILHKFGDAQAHFGKAGLHMLSFNPKDNANLYLFNDDSRASAIDALMEDIPRYVSQSGKAILVEQFYKNTYNETPAHSEDIHQAIIDNQELEVITKEGGARRKANTIKIDDIIRLKPQKSFYF